jgi:hypothetical protein
MSHSCSIAHLTRPPGARFGHQGFHVSKIDLFMRTQCVTLNSTCFCCSAASTYEFSIRPKPMNYGLPQKCYYGGVRRRQKRSWSEFGRRVVRCFTASVLTGRFRLRNQRNHVWLRG